MQYHSLSDLPRPAARETIGACVSTRRKFPSPCLVGADDLCKQLNLLRGFYLRVGLGIVLPDPEASLGPRLSGAVSLALRRRNLEMYA